MKNKNLSITSFFKNLFSEVTSVDNRITKTLIALITKPGYLTNLHIKSSDENYIPPIRLYFIINFIFFLVIPILSSSQFQVFNFNLESFSRGNEIYKNIVVEEIVTSGVSKEIYEERFDSNLKYNQPALVFLIVPFFALLLKIIFLRKKIYYLEHLYFALHYLSFFLCGLTLSIIVYRISVFALSYFSVSSGVVAAVIIIALFIWLTVHLFLALRTFYKNSTLSNIIVYPFMFIGFYLSLAVYAQFLFFYTILVLKWGY